MNGQDASPGTIWRMDISPWFEHPKCDVFLLVLGPSSEHPDEISCLIVGIDTNAFEVRPGRKVSVRRSDLRPMF